MTRNRREPKARFAVGGMATLLLPVEILDAPPITSRFGREYFVREPDGRTRWVWEVELRGMPTPYARAGGAVSSSACYWHDLPVDASVSVGNNPTSPIRKWFDDI